MGPFMVEIVFCRVTRRGRKLKKGMNKAGRENMRNDGPAQSFIPAEDTIKVTLDLSDNGPVFSAMDEMMMKMLDDDAKDRKNNKSSGNEAKASLKRLMKSGIPGVEKLFSGPNQAPAGPGKKGSKGFHKMNDSSKQKFMTAVFGEDGTTIDSQTAAALLAATCSGGDPSIGNNLAELLLPEMGDTVDPAMMAALMSSCSMINAGASTEEVMKAMKAELKASGLTEEEILQKTTVLMKAFNKTDPTADIAQYALASKQKNSALKKNNTSPKDFTLAVLVMKAIAACGSSPENVAKVIMIMNQLSKKGAQSRFISDALKHLADYDAKRAQVIENLTKAFDEEKLGRNDVFLNVRMTQAIENENEPTWKDVKNMKEIVQGCSPSSPEGIELNLARATKSGGLGKNDIAAVLVAQKVMAALQVDPKSLAQIINMMKLVAENGVPSVEIARVLSDGVMPKELTDVLIPQILDALSKDLAPPDVDAWVNVYDNLRLKANIPLEVIEHIDNTLIQVRCSLEDVADNLVCGQIARGEKDANVIRALCDTLIKTGASPEIVATTMMAALKRVLDKGQCDIMKDIGRTLHEQGTEKENLNKAMTTLLLNVLNDDPDGYETRMEALKAMELVLKEAGGFPNEIRAFMDSLELPPEPPDPKVLAELERQRQEEEDRLRKEQEAADAAAAAEAAKLNGVANPALDGLKAEGAGSRRGSASSVTLGGVERQGSYYDDDVVQKATVAMVVDDPEQKENMSSIFDAEPTSEPADVLESILSATLEEEDLGPNIDDTLRAIRQGKVTDEEVNKLLAVFQTQGVVSSVGGVTRLRKISDIRNTLEATSRSFDEAITNAQNAEAPQISDTNRKLMEDILRRTSQTQNEMSSRVTALLAGSALTTKAGVRIERRDTVEQVDYTAVGDDLEPLKQTKYAPRRRKAQSAIQGPVSLHQANSEELEHRAHMAGIKVQRRSIKRMSLARLRKTSEFSGLRPMGQQNAQNGDVEELDQFDEVDEHRKIKGLKHSKVPMMVYSHGGFSRCFRIARRYQVDGPPIGVEYFEETEAEKTIHNAEVVGTNA